MTFVISKDDISHPRVASWYARYISSVKWHEFCETIYKSRGRTCESCKENKLLLIHHLTYARVTKERADDVKILCKECHKLAHFKKIIPLAERIYDEYDPVGSKFK